MECQQLRSQIESLALCPQTDPMPADMLEHLHGCARCREELSESQEAWLMLSASLPTDPISDKLESRVMDRVLNAPSPVPEYSQNAVVWKYAVAASVLFLLAGTTMYRLGVFSGNQSTKSDVEQIRKIAAQVDELDKLERTFASTELRFVSLNTASERASGYLVYDSVSKQIHFFGSNLRVVEQPLVVWLLDENENVIATSSIRLGKDASVGTALLSGAEIERVRTTLITVEQQSDVDVPSTNILLRCPVTRF